MLTSTSNVATSALLPPVRRSRQYQAETEHTGPNLVHMQALPCNLKKGQLLVSKPQIQSRYIRCSAASNATCAATQTQTLTRESKTVTLIPRKAKTAQLDDSGPGLPPFSDNGNGGNGGGGGKFSGGLVLLGILGILDVLKEIENEWRRKDDDRRRS